MFAETFIVQPPAKHNVCVDTLAEDLVPQLLQVDILKIFCSRQILLQLVKSHTEIIGKAQVQLGEKEIIQCNPFRVGKVVLILAKDVLECVLNLSSIRLFNELILRELCHFYFWKLLVDKEISELHHDLTCVFELNELAGHFRVYCHNYHVILSNRHIDYFIRSQLFIASECISCSNFVLIIFTTTRSQVKWLWDLIVDIFDMVSQQAVPSRAPDPDVSIIVNCCTIRGVTRHHFG